MLYRSFWLCGLVLLIGLSLVALWDVSFQTCGEQIPILLSRALTTDPYRGLTLAFCLIAVASSLYLNSILIIAGFFGFFSAFLVSMFQTNAHNALILVSATFIMYECYPTTQNRIWIVQWWSTVLVGVACSIWLVCSVHVCKPEEYDETGPLPDSVRCARCSYWYITEYLFFWSMFSLVYWRIPKDLVWRDQVSIVSAKVGSGDPEEKKKLLF
tara:strand:+ start:268 stop:906 length:639 start_codon:yes stop_codon:yes gene_type:complete